MPVLKDLKPDYSRWSDDQVATPDPVHDKIRDRLSWFAVLAGGLLVIVVAWRIIVLPADAIKMEFQFADLLSLLLALFAVAASAAFYFRSTRDSNTFFANSYKFTRDVAEILGRIEAGFGERLRHLDEGYSSMRDRFDSLPNGLHEATEKLKSEEARVVAFEKQRADIIRKALAASEDEKAALLQRLAAKDSELEAMRNAMLKTRRVIERTGETVLRTTNERPLKKYLLRKFILPVGPVEIRHMSHEQLRETFQEWTSELDPNAGEDMMALGWFDEEEGLTKLGAKTIKSIAFELKS